MKSEFVEQIAKGFPKSFPQINDEDMIKGELISPFVVELPRQVLEDAKKFIEGVYRIKEGLDYQEQLPAQIELKVLPKTPSVLSCFDFHYSQETGLKLIEVNTNASLFLPLCLLQKSHGCHEFSQAEEQLFDSFTTTYGKTPSSIVILDKEPTKEGLYFEFLIFKEWFERQGVECHIQSLKEYNTNPASDFVYNRYNDFYLERDESEKLLENYIEERTILSPNPREYFLMADKKRLPILQNYEELKKFIPLSKVFSDFASPEELWSERKQYFFKPSQSFGSKAVYQGKSISKTNFQKIFSPDYLAQEWVPPGRIHRSYQGEEIELKYDLRFFSFQGQVQNAGARLYRGQTTNMKTPFGGLAPLCFS